MVDVVVSLDVDVVVSLDVDVVDVVVVVADSFAFGVVVDVSLAKRCSAWLSHAGVGSVEPTSVYVRVESSVAWSVATWNCWCLTSPSLVIPSRTVTFASLAFPNAEVFAMGNVVGCATYVWRVLPSNCVVPLYVKFARSVREATPGETYPLAFTERSAPCAYAVRLPVVIRV